jgi:uncharacterized membrane protein (DUF373 family)
MADGDKLVGVTSSSDPALDPVPPGYPSHYKGFNRWLQQSADLIKHAEQTVYAVIGAMLVLALILALLGSLTLLFEGARDLSHTDAIFQIIDRLLFVLMLVEILHTVHASIRSGTLVCEPFLIVGLIACIRRILVITLETSQITQPERWGAGNMPLFQASMTELGVLALLIVVLVGSIRFTRRTES